MNVAFTTVTFEVNGRTVALLQEEAERQAKEYAGPGVTLEVVSITAKEPSTDQEKSLYGLEAVVVAEAKTVS